MPRSKEEILEDVKKHYAKISEEDKKAAHNKIYANNDFKSDKPLGTLRILDVALTSIVKTSYTNLPDSLKEEINEIVEALAEKKDELKDFSVALYEAALGIRPDKNLIIEKLKDKVTPEESDYRFVVLVKEKTDKQGLDKITNPKDYAAEFKKAMIDAEVNVLERRLKNLKKSISIITPPISPENLKIVEIEILDPIIQKLKKIENQELDFSELHKEKMRYKYYRLAYFEYEVNLHKLESNKEGHNQYLKKSLDVLLKELSTLNPQDAKSSEIREKIEILKRKSLELELMEVESYLSANNTQGLKDYLTKMHQELEKCELACVTNLVRGEKSEYLINAHYYQYIASVIHQAEMAVLKNTSKTKSEIFENNKNVIDTPWDKYARKTKENIEELELKISKESNPDQLAFLKLKLDHWKQNKLNIELEGEKVVEKDNKKGAARYLKSLQGKEQKRLKTFNNELDIIIANKKKDVAAKGELDFTNEEMKVIDKFVDDLKQIYQALLLTKKEEAALQISNKEKNKLLNSFLVKQKNEYTNNLQKLSQIKNAIDNLLKQKNELVAQQESCDKEISKLDNELKKPKTRELEEKFQKTKQALQREKEITQKITTVNSEITKLGEALLRASNQSTQNTQPDASKIDPVAIQQEIKQKKTELEMLEKEKKMNRDIIDEGSKDKELKNLMLAFVKKDKQEASKESAEKQINDIKSQLINAVKELKSKQLAIQVLKEFVDNNQTIALEQKWASNEFGAIFEDKKNISTNPQQEEEHGKIVKFEGEMKKKKALYANVFVSPKLDTDKQKIQLNLQRLLNGLVFSQGAYNIPNIEQYKLTIKDVNDILKSGLTKEDRVIYTNDELKKLEELFSFEELAELSENEYLPALQKKISNILNDRPSGTVTQHALTITNLRTEMRKIFGYDIIAKQAERERALNIILRKHLKFLEEEEAKKQSNNDPNNNTTGTGSGGGMATKSSKEEKNLTGPADIGSGIGNGEGTGNGPVDKHLIEMLEKAKGDYLKEKAEKEKALKLLEEQNRKLLEQQEKIKLEEERLKEAEKETNDLKNQLQNTTGVKKRPPNRFK